MDVIIRQATCRKSADGSDILLMIIITTEEKQRAPLNGAELPDEGRGRCSERGAVI